MPVDAIRGLHGDIGVWSGRRLLVWGRTAYCPDGGNAAGVCLKGASYDPTADQWGEHFAQTPVPAPPSVWPPAALHVPARSNFFRTDECSTVFVLPGGTIAP